MAKTTCKTIKTQICRYKTIFIHIERDKTCLCVTVSHSRPPLAYVSQRKELVLKGPVSHYSCGRCPLECVI